MDSARLKLMPSSEAMPSAQRKHEIARHGFDQPTLVPAPEAESADGACRFVTTMPRGHLCSARRLSIPDREHAVVKTYGVGSAHLTGSEAHRRPPRVRRSPRGVGRTTCDGGAPPLVCAYIASIATTVIAARIGRRPAQEKAGDETSKCWPMRTSM